MLTAALTTSFLLELGALVAIGVWGFATRGAAVGIGLPLAVAVVWGAFIGPGAATPGAVKAVLQVLVFGAAAAALAATHRPALAAAFAAAVAVDALAMSIWE